MGDIMGKTKDSDNIGAIGAGVTGYVFLTNGNYCTKIYKYNLLGEIKWSEFVAPFQTRHGGLLDIDIWLIIAKNEDLAREGAELLKTEQYWNIPEIENMGFKRCRVEVSLFGWRYRFPAWSYLKGLI